MYSFKAFTLLSTLLLAGVGSARLSTTIGLETDEGSHSVQIPFDDCTQVGQL
ncbi:integral membrane protein PTH11-like [Aspergillus luchuensis]|uniref:Integral membrane protein PTH11-like n=1 Tax=Aspergillus kawachii TaxID=1069201 RepID=A0A146FXZ1_ASPKA|nr:integral membrane protein PTH11-like [Aspergillus luchuensis]